MPKDKIRWSKTYAHQFQEYTWWKPCQRMHNILRFVWSLSHHGLPPSLVLHDFFMKDLVMQTEER
jgi:hypothetical protein